MTGYSVVHSSMRPGGGWPLTEGIRDSRDGADLERLRPLSGVRDKKPKQHKVHREEDREYDKHRAFVPAE